MNYRLLPHHQLHKLKDLIYDIYEITTNSTGLEYSTAPNGIIGISIILSGHSSILTDKRWQKIPQASIYGLAKKPDIIKISPHFREIAIGFKPYFLQLLLNDSMSNIISTGNVDAKDVFSKSDIENLIELIGLSINDFQMKRTITS